MKACSFALLWLILAAEAGAQQTPAPDAETFPQFRNLTGLAGGGYGANTQGYSSLSGPTAYSTPVAHVLGHGQWRVFLAKTSHGRKPAIRASQSNGTFVSILGLTFGQVNVAVSHMLLSSSFDQAFHLQAQYIPARAERLVGSVGVQDIGGGGGSAGEDIPGDARSSRSLFAVATYRTGPGEAGPYLSAGWGTRRFSRPFGSVSMQVAPPLRLWMEHDGFGVNAGALWTWRLHVAGRTEEVHLVVGALKGRYFTFALGGGF